MTVPSVLHPRQTAGTPVGGQFTRVQRAEGGSLDDENLAPDLHIMGVTDEQTECDKCGKVELKRTVIVHDEDGNEHGRYGTSCASNILGVKWTAPDVDKLELNRRRQVVSDIRKAGGHLLKGDAAMAAELLADARTTGLHRPDETKKWDELFAQVPPEVYAHRPPFIARLGIERTAPDTSAPVDSGTVMVTDSLRKATVFTPGVIDANARWAYTNGQCMALAVALSARTGWPIATRTWIDDDSDDEDGHPDDDGQRARVEYLIHAAVRTPDEDLLDISGVGDPGAIELEDEECWTDWLAGSAPVVLTRFAAGLREQNYAAAETFVDSVLELYSDDQAHYAKMSDDPD